MVTDAIDLSTVQIHNSHDVRGWPITATLSQLQFRPTGVHVEHSKRNGDGCWPNFRPAGWDGDLQYTLWIFLNLNGQWHGCGGIQFWQSCDQNGGAPEKFAQDWYYDVNRWGPMTGHQPVPGERVGFMVSAGDSRGEGMHPVSERSQVIAIGFPNSGDVWDLPVVVDPPVPEPPAPIPDPPTPIPVPSPPTPSLPPNSLATILTGILSAFQSINAKLDRCATHADVVALQAELEKQGQAIVVAISNLTPVIGHTDTSVAGNPLDALNTLAKLIKR